MSETNQKETNNTTTQQESSTAMSETTNQTTETTETTAPQDNQTEQPSEATETTTAPQEGEAKPAAAKDEPATKPAAAAAAPDEEDEAARSRQQDKELMALRYRSLSANDSQLNKHVVHMINLDLDKDHPYYEFWRRAYHPADKTAGMSASDVNRRIAQEVLAHSYNNKGERSACPTFDLFNLNLAIWLNPITHHLGLSELGWQGAWRELLPPWRVPSKGKRRSDAEMEITDGDLYQCYLEIAAYWGFNTTLIKEGVLYKAIKARIDGNQFNVWVEYIESLPVWDGVKRLRNWLGKSQSHTETEQMMKEAWWLNTMRRWYEPGCKMDYALVLVGPPGTGKTTTLEGITAGVVLPQQLTTIPEGSRDKDDMKILHQTPLPIMDEIDRWSLRTPGSKDGTDAKLKSMLTRSSDTWRDPWGKATNARPRPSVIVGTTNFTEYIGDPIGARRFLSIPITNEILAEEKSPETRDLLLAEARDRYKGGEKILTDDDPGFKEAVAAHRTRFIAGGTSADLTDWFTEEDELRHPKPTWKPDGLINGTASYCATDTLSAKSIMRLALDIDRDTLSRSEATKQDGEIQRLMDNREGYERIPLTGRARVRVGATTERARVFWRRKRDRPGHATYGPETLPPALLPLPAGIAGWGFVPDEDGLGTERGWVPAADNPEPRPKWPKDRKVAGYGPHQPAPSVYAAGSEQERAARASLREDRERERVTKQHREAEKHRGSFNSATAHLR